LKIKIKFVDFWDGFNENENYFTKILSKNFDIEVSNDPEFLLYSVYGCEHLKFNCLKIFFTAENIVPNFNECDYALGYHYIDFESRYLRWPLYAMNEGILSLVEDKINITGEEIRLKDKFCNFIYSNPNGILRNELYEKLSKYKSIDSAGKYLNNYGIPVENKFQFQSGYKFSIAFENSLGSGYTSEKIVDAFAAKTIPIYWGNPKISNEFNEGSFINIHRYNSLDEVVQLVKTIDSDKKLFDNYLKCPAFENKNEIDISKFDNFFCNIFENKVIYNNHLYISNWQKRYFLESELLCFVKKRFLIKMLLKFIYKIINVKKKLNN